MTIWNIQQLQELAGIKESTKSHNLLSEHALSKEKYRLENLIASTFLMNETVTDNRLKLVAVNNKLSKLTEYTLKEQAHDVHLNGKHIDTVFYNNDIDSETVKKSLIDHDGYDSRITVKKRRNKKNVKESEETQESIDELSETSKKVKIEWEVQSLYNGEWETSTTEDSKEEILKRIKEYRENEPKISHRLRRVKVTESAENGQIKEFLIVEEVGVIPSASETLPTVFGTDEHTDNKKETDDSRGITQDVETKIVLPKDLFKHIDARASELQDSMDQYDKLKFTDQTSSKEKAQDCLKHFKELLTPKTLKGFKEATVYYGTVASHISSLFPAKLIEFLHNGVEQETEIPTTSYGDGAKDKKKESDIPNQSSVKLANTSIYPQIPQSKDKPN